MSDSLQPHELQDARYTSHSPSPGIHSNSCPLSQWCYLTISSSTTPFTFCLQSFPASGSFPVSQLFTSGGQMYWAAALVSVLPMNFQGWFHSVDYVIKKNWKLLVIMMNINISSFNKNKIKSIDYLPIYLSIYLNG